MKTYALFIEYTNTSNGYFILNVPMKTINSQIKWQKKHNGQWIKSIQIIRG